MDAVKSVTSAQDAIAQAGRIVVKIGSSLLTDLETGALRAEWLNALIGDVAALTGSGKEIVIVSSGAVALGRADLGLPSGTLRLEESQAAAAAGQIRLAHAYQHLLGEHGLKAAQVLLTIEDTEQRRRYLNARSTLTTLVRLGAVPIVNENDTVATQELRYGDNDRLAARVAAMVGADLLIILSDVDGLYDRDPRTGEPATLLETIETISPDIHAMAGGTGSFVGSGGMKTKIDAAVIATAAGAHVVIARGTIAHPLATLQDGAKASLFISHDSPGSARKSWIGGTLQASGTIHVDDGAARALLRGKSLLPAGVTAIEGRFHKGDAVDVKGPDGQVLARGLVGYDADEAGRIKGAQSAEIEEILGIAGRATLIHRDDLVLTNAPQSPKSKEDKD